MIEKLAVFTDGQSVVNHVFEVLDNLDLRLKDNKPVIQPISLLLLDINMPQLTGIEACKQIRRKYDEINHRAEEPESMADHQTHVLKPFICYLTGL